MASTIHAELPRGRPCTMTSHVTIGSVRSINPSQLDAFLAAVEAAFPITEASVFACEEVGYENNADRPNRPALRLCGPAGGVALAKSAIKARLAARLEALREEVASRKGDGRKSVQNVRRNKKDVTLQAMDCTTGPTGPIKKMTKRRPTQHRQPTQHGHGRRV